MIYAEYLKVNTINENILRQALDVLRVKPDFYVDPGEYDTFPRCESLREKTARRARPGGSRRSAKRGKTAEKEIRHEQKNDSCGYLEKAPFARLFKHSLEEFKVGVKVTLRTMSFVQFVVESLLVKL